MSEMIIEIVSGNNEHMETPEVWVEGTFAYSTVNPKIIEAGHIKRVLDLLGIENYRIDVK